MAPISSVRAATRRAGRGCRTRGIAMRCAPCHRRISALRWLPASPSLLRRWSPERIWLRPRIVPTAGLLAPRTGRRPLRRRRSWRVRGRLFRPADLCSGPRDHQPAVRSANQCLLEQRARRGLTAQTVRSSPRRRGPRNRDAEHCRCCWILACADMGGNLANHIRQFSPARKMRNVALPRAIG